MVRLLKKRDRRAEKNPNVVLFRQKTLSDLVENLRIVKRDQVCFCVSSYDAKQVCETRRSGSPVKRCARNPYLWWPRSPRFRNKRSCSEMTVQYAFWVRTVRGIVLRIMTFSNRENHGVFPEVERVKSLRKRQKEWRKRGANLGLHFKDTGWNTGRFLDVQRTVFATSP